MIQQQKVSARNIPQFLMQEHREINKGITGLDGALLNLRFEGKNCLGKNVKRIDKVWSSLYQALLCHMALEEKVLFPFLEKHVPKLEPLICVLYSEHRNLKENMNTIHTLLKKNSKKGAGPLAGKDLRSLVDVGIYLVYLLRSHAHTEDTSVYRSANKQLQANEKSRLAKGIRDYKCSYC